MGWCSATDLFDQVLDHVLTEVKDPEAFVDWFYNYLADSDWDCEDDSRYSSHPYMEAAVRKRHPGWFEDI